VINHKGSEWKVLPDPEYSLREAYAPNLLRAMLHDEEKEFQIRLAELQADIQIYLTSCWGMVAVLFTILVGLQQIFFILRPDQYLVAISFSITIPALAVIGLLIVHYFLNKIEIARRQISALRKKYCW
jgi:hypothetical protein